MSRAKRQARRTVRKTKRAVRKTNRKAARAARGGRPKFLPPLPFMKKKPKGLADLTNAPGLDTPAGGPSLNDISQGATAAGEFPQPAGLGLPAETPGASGGLSGIQEDPFKTVGPMDFGEPEQEPLPEEVESEEVQDEEQGEENYSDIIGDAIGGIGNAVGGILKGLNINTGAHKKAKNDAVLAAYQAKVAAAQAAAGGNQPKKSNTALYIGIGVVVLVVVVIVVMMKKKK